MTAAQVDGFDTIISAATNITTCDIITLSDAMTATMLDGTVLGSTAADELVIKLADVASNALTVANTTFDTVADTLYIDGGLLTGTNALTFDGSAETTAAVFNVVGGAAADSITGGDGADIINGGAGADTLTGDGAADTFVFTKTSTAAPSATVFDTIVGFATASDKIDYAVDMTIVTNTTTAAAGTGATSSAGITTFHSDDDTLAERIIAAEASIATGSAADGQVTAFMVASDAYIFISDGTDGVDANDTLIKLTAVDLTVSTLDTITLSSGDFTLA
jgi:Ca2+-binding RTX toxin-like protein